MKLGVIARSEDRGLGNLTWEFVQHIEPERVLVVVPNHPLTQRLDRFPDALVLQWDHHAAGELDEDATREWLRGLDVVYSAETFYDWRVCTWAREMGVRTVCHVMPEFFRHYGDDAPAAPDAWWSPTGWRRDCLPDSTRIVPVPIATERFVAQRRNADPRPHWLHVVGMRAAADRNGTRVVNAALRYVKGDHLVRIRTQEERYQRPATARGVDLEIVNWPVPEYWELYHDADALVLPRRYAGLSLPALEAMGAGLGLVMSDVEPQRSEWPILGLPARQTGTVRAPAGIIPTATVPPQALAELMSRCAADPSILEGLRARAAAFAAEHSWAALEPLIRAELAAVAAS